MARSLDFTKALAAVEAGDRVFVTHPDPDKPKQRMTVATLGGQRQITLTAWDRLRPFMSPVEDGLFPGASQTFAGDAGKLAELRRDETRKSAQGKARRAK